MHPILALVIIITIIIAAIAIMGYLVIQFIRMVRNRGGSTANRSGDEPADTQAALPPDTGASKDNES